MRAPRGPRSWKRDADECIRIAMAADEAEALRWGPAASCNRVRQTVLDFFAGTFPKTLRVRVRRTKLQGRRGYHYNIVFARNRRRCARG